MLIESPPTVQLSKLVNSLKAVASRRLRNEFLDLWAAYSKPELWSRSYLVGSCGGAPLEVVKRYIQQYGTGCFRKGRPSHHYKKHGPYTGEGNFPEVLLRYIVCIPLRRWDHRPLGIGRASVCRALENYKQPVFIGMSPANPCPFWTGR